MSCGCRRDIILNHDQPAARDARRSRHPARAADRGAPRRARRGGGRRPALGALVHLSSGAGRDAGVHRRRAQGSAATATCCRGPCAISPATPSSARRATTTSSRRSIAWRSATPGTRPAASGRNVNTTCKLLLLAHAFDTLRLQGRRPADRQFQLPLAARDRGHRREEGRRDPSPRRAEGRHRARLGDVQHPRRGVAGRQTTPGAAPRAACHVSLNVTT